MQVLTQTAAWTFPVDTGLRRKLFVPEVFCHPAKLHLGLLQKLLDIYAYLGDTLLDPMAGGGSLLLAATQQINVVLRDLQPEYVDMMNASLPLIRHHIDWAGTEMCLKCGQVIKPVIKPLKREAKS